MRKYFIVIPIAILLAFSVVYADRDKPTTRITSTLGYNMSGYYITSSAPTADNQMMVCDNDTGVWLCTWQDVPRDGDWVLGSDDYFNAKSSFYSAPFHMVPSGDNATTEALCQTLGSVCFNEDNATEVYIGSGASAVRFGGGSGGGGTATDFALTDDVCGSFGTGSDFLLCYDSVDNRLEIRKSDNSTLLYFETTGGMGMSKTANIPGTYLLNEWYDTNTNGTGIAGPVIRTAVDTYFAFPASDNCSSSDMAASNQLLGAVLAIGKPSTIDSKIIHQLTPVYLGAVPASSYSAAHTYSITESFITVSGTTTITVPAGKARTIYSPYVEGVAITYSNTIDVLNVGTASVTVNFADADDFKLNGVYYTTGKILVSQSEEVNCIGGPTTTGIWFCEGTKHAPTLHVTYAAD